MSAQVSSGRVFVMASSARNFDIALTKKEVRSRNKNSSDSQVWHYQFRRSELGPAAMTILPQLRGLKRMLSDLGATQEIMTRSGSAILGICTDLEGARNPNRELTATAIWERQVRVLECSPELLTEEM